MQPQFVCDYDTDKLCYPIVIDFIWFPDRVANRLVLSIDHPIAIQDHIWSYPILLQTSESEGI